jgi:hypothetical protein
LPVLPFSARRYNRSGDLRCCLHMGCPSVSCLLLHDAPVWHPPHRVNPPRGGVVGDRADPVWDERAPAPPREGAPGL